MQNRTDGDPYENLANAVVSVAAKDYLAALKKVKRKATNKDAMQEAMDLERFFHSAWYAQLTSVDPDYLIRRLRNEVSR
jgi:Tfp pilus assembly protein PilE